MDSDGRYFIQEINNGCYVLVYENNIKNFDESNESFLKKKYENEIVDFIIIKEYDETKNITKFEIFNKDDYLDLKNIFHDLVDGKYFIVNGKQDILSLPVIGNEELYSVIKQPQVGEIFILSKNETFVLLELKNISDEYSNPNFIELLKKIYCDYFFVVFKTSSDMVYYDESNATIGNIYKYVIYFNNKSVKRVENRLFYNIFGGDNFIIFESHKEFKDLFSNGIDPDKHDYEKYIDNYSDTDSDSD
uniref:Uncharacterized protein n=1 Tax=Borely moumouvirus TaxID=2712067 RepID=A0A6G6ACW4_9VIRU